MNIAGSIARPDDGLTVGVMTNNYAEAISARHRTNRLRPALDAQVSVTRPVVSSVPIRAQLPLLTPAASTVLTLGLKTLAERCRSGQTGLALHSPQSGGNDPVLDKLIVRTGYAGYDPTW
jgi:hypothetical protein